MNSSGTMRGPAMVAGLSLFAMAVLGGLANFGVLENVVTEGDAERTAQAIRDSEGLFRYAVLGLTLVAILDVIVAKALLDFFKPVHEGVATLAAWLRLAYAGVFLVAIGQLAGALPLAGDPWPAGAYTPEQFHAEALLKINGFHDLWHAGLTFFGLHLLLLGYLAYRWARVVGVLLGIAGLGYLVDSFGAVLGHTPDAAVFTFVGEVVLMLWLLVKGRNIIPSSVAVAS
ncbi:DUF4386 domain-containing protein [Nonomuraea sp. ZG12]|uniref:DUF4386 domain-containing protein n=1 Tax=Nonomuraea sp. ZG12 TaxID=3452207 RepID=UPI003F8C0FA6